MYLKDIYRTFHPNTKDYTFFSAPHRTFSKIDHLVNYKASLKRYKNIEVTPCIFENHHG
jgi:exonuclease III